MSKVIVVANSKGGVGKSTIAVNLAVCAAHIEGLKTLLIDSDKQGSSMDFRAIRTSDNIQAVSITQPTIHKDIDGFASYDIIIIDAGGSDDSVFRSAMTAAAKGLLLIPILPSQYDIWATQNTFDILKAARIFVNIPAYVIFNQVIQNTIISKEAAEAMRNIVENNNVEMLKTELYSRMDYKTSVAAGLGVIEFQPKGKAAEEMTALYNELKAILWR